MRSSACPPRGLQSRHQRMKSPPKHLWVCFRQVTPARKPSSGLSWNCLTPEGARPAPGGTRKRERSTPPAFRLPRTPHEHAHALAHAARGQRCGQPGRGPGPFGGPAISGRALARASDWLVASLQHEPRPERPAYGRAPVDDRALPVELDVIADLSPQGVGVHRAVRAC